MADIVKLITVIPRDLAIEFIDVKRLSSLDTMPQIHPAIKSTIRDAIREYVGYDNEPIAGLSRFNNTPSELKSVGTSISEYIPTKPGSTLWELNMPEDMVISVSFTDLLTYNSMVAGIPEGDDLSLEITLEDFKGKISIGYVEGEDVISFIPFIDLNRCKFFALIDQSWGIGDFTVPGVEQIKLTNLHVF